MKKTSFLKSIALTALILTVAVLVLSSCAMSRKSVDGAYINEAGELVLRYSDGGEENLGMVTGADGTDGTDGVDGKNGIDGKDGVDGKDITEKIILNSDESDIALGTAKALRSAVSIISGFTLAGEDAAAAGAGVIYKLDKTAGDAYIITNYHVVYETESDELISDNISVYLYGSEYQDFAIPATFIGGSYNYDIAVLKVEGSELLKNSDALALTHADSNKISLGETVIAIGNPLGSGMAATVGVISVDSEMSSISIGTGETAVNMRLIRTDAALNHGNSGGGLFDADGNLVGIVNSKIEAVDVENVGNAIPSNAAVAIADNVIANCDGVTKTAFRRPLIGITMVVTAAGAYFDEESKTVIIKEVNRVDEITPSSIAAGKAEVGDVILEASLNDEPLQEILRSHYLIELLYTAMPGDVLNLKVKRGEGEVLLAITITEDCVVDY